MAENKKIPEKNGELTPEIWGLEKAFPDVGDLLSPARVGSAADRDVILVLDTNVLLLPFKVGGEELQAIEGVYAKWIEQKRLFVPDRVIREYLKNRDGTLADIQKNTRDKSSAVSAPSLDIAQFLKRLPETEAVVTAFSELKKARKTYLDAVDALVQRMLDWRGDDPVTEMYRRLFVDDVVFQLSTDKHEVQKEWIERSKGKVPPGYKDGAKPDTGIGDFLIWLAILELGKFHKKDMIFVTGEEKADWLVRANNEGVYPRPELIDEYRRFSGGKNLKIARFADVLSDMEVPDELVHDVREADLSDRPGTGRVNRLLNSWIVNVVRTRSIDFDYSTHDGSIIVSDSDGTNFDLRFSKASNQAIHFYRTSDLELIGRARDTTPGDPIWFGSLDSSSSSYKIKLGELFLARHKNGKTLVGRVTAIEDEDRGDSRDNVAFNFIIYNVGEPLLAP